MKLQDPITSAQTMSRSILRLNVAEESRNNGPSLQKFVNPHARCESQTLVHEFLPKMAHCCDFLPRRLTEECS